MSAAEAPGQRWLFGPLSDLFFGCGLLYALVFAAQAVAGDELASLFPLSWLPFLTLVLGAPHYGATLLRVYETRESRQRYAFFGVWVSLALGIAYLVALRSPMFGSLLLTLYLTWSPWHYSGQNYGVGLLFLRRRGVPVAPLAKRLLYASFFLSFLLTVLAIHTLAPSAAYAPAAYEGTVYRLIPLGIPTPAYELLFPLMLAAYLATTAGALGLVARGATLAQLGPTLLLVVTQALWFAVPTACRHFGWLQGIHPLANANAAYTVMWVAAGHFLQYLWITTYYGVATASARGKLRYLAKALLAGAALWTLPTLLFAPGVLGRLPYDLGLGLITAATVNLHHFILDGAIWKLREGPIANVLLRPRTAAGPGPAPLRVGRLAPLVWVGGAACVAVMALAFWEELRLQRAAERMDIPRIRTAYQRAQWIGRDTPKIHLALARLAVRDRNLAGAAREYEKAIALYPTAEAWAGLASVYESEGDLARAEEASEAALALAPENAQLLYQAGLLRLRRGDAEGARELLARAVERAPGQRLMRLKLEQAEREAAAARTSPN